MNTSFKLARLPYIITCFIAIICLQNPIDGQTNKTAGANEHIAYYDSANRIIIHQEINFNVSPQRLYETLLSSKYFSDCIKKSFNNFSANSAIIDPVAGGSFSLFDGHIIGRILELVPNQRIVEAWRVVDWPDGMYSIAKFEIKSAGPGETLVIFDHIGFPEGLKEHLSLGWQQHYWKALATYFTK
jgi:activator of HSP90 ATPase